MLNVGSIFPVLFVVLLACSAWAQTQTADIKFIADTLVIQADGTCHADPISQP
jgi:hypothetical protein